MSVDRAEQRPDQLGLPDAQRGGQRDPPRVHRGDRTQRGLPGVRDAAIGASAVPVGLAGADPQHQPVRAVSHVLDVQGGELAAAQRPGVAEQHSARSRTPFSTHGSAGSPATGSGASRRAISAVHSAVLATAAV